MLANYPGAPEREAALQQKALILGQLDDAKGMAATFQQLLKEFPKSAAAAQAHYYIGKAAFEAKDYETAIAEMNQARQLNKDQYGGPAALRIMSSYFYLKQRDALAKEVDKFYAASPNGQVPAEILEWLGIEFYNAKNYATAAKYLTALSKTGNVTQRETRLLVLSRRRADENRISRPKRKLRSRNFWKRRPTRPRKRKRSSPWAKRKSARTNRTTRKRSRKKS